MIVERLMKFLRAHAVVAYVALSIAASSQPPAPGVTGRAVLKGEPPPELEISMDAPCLRLETNRISTRHYRVGTNGGLANVVVFVRGNLRDWSFPVPTNAVEIAFDRCQMNPHVTAARTGQSVRFINRDRIVHHVHTLARSERVMGRPAPRLLEPVLRTFHVEEMFIRCKCDVHPWEYAYVSVFDHPFFAVTDADGRFQLPPGLPDGTYVIEAHHRKAGTRSVTISVRDGRARVPDFVYGD
jgi:plastocyanin